MITIRQYKPEDVQALWEVFFFTVHNINIQHYSKQQVEAWAPDNCNQEAWQEKMLQISPYIAEIDGRLQAIQICKILG